MGCRFLLQGIFLTLGFYFLKATEIHHCFVIKKKKVSVVRYKSSGEQRVLMRHGIVHRGHLRPVSNLRLPGISFWAAHTLLQKLPPTLFLPKFSPGLSVLGLNPVPAGVTQPEYLRVDAGSKGRAHEWGVPTGVPGGGRSLERAAPMHRKNSCPS